MQSLVMIDRRHDEQATTLSPVLRKVWFVWRQCRHVLAAVYQRLSFISISLSVVIMLRRFSVGVAVCIVSLCAPVLHLGYALAYRPNACRVPVSTAPTPMIVHFALLVPRIAS